MPLPPEDTPSRRPKPPRPTTMESIVASHEREKRRQQRPVTKTNTLDPEDSGFADDAPLRVSVTDSGTISGTGGSFSVAFTLPAEGTWLLTPRLVAGSGARVQGVAGDHGYIEIGVSNALGTFDGDRHPLVLPYSATTAYTALSVAAGSWRSALVWDTSEQFSGSGSVEDRLSMSIDVAGGGTVNWSSSGGGGALVDVRLYGVRLGPAQPATA